MDHKDRACFNCEASTLIKVPMVKATCDADYISYCSCRQRLSDHYRHLSTLLHVCAWHSDLVQYDDRYPHWRDSIDEHKEVPW